MSGDKAPTTCTAASEVSKVKTTANDDGRATGFVFAGLVRASLYWLKRSVVMLPIKKQAFLRIGRLTQQPTPTADCSGIKTSTTKSSLASKGLTKELAKSAVLGMAVFGTYEYLVHHYMDADHDFSAERSTVFAHVAAGACAGLVQSCVLTSWELSTFFYTHDGHLPQHVRLPFLQRRAVHHVIGYASLFGSYEATRRVLLHAACAILERSNLLLDSTNDSRRRARTVVSLASAFVAGGIAGQVHHFVSYVTTHWKLQALSSSETVPSSVTKHAQNYTRLPSVRANLSAFGPTALCFVAFQYGETLSERIKEQDDKL